MTPTELDAASQQRLALVDALVIHAQRLSAVTGQNLFDLAVASPGVVLSLFVLALERIDEADAPEDAKMVTRRCLQFQVERVLALVLAVVRSDDPQAALRAQNAEWTHDPDGQVH